MSGKNRALAIVAAVVGLIGLWIPSALASTTTNGPVNAGSGSALINGGQVNVFLGSENTAVGNTCNNKSSSGAENDNILAWALDLTHNTCAMAGGPNHL